ncbi:hypothetical protein NL108_009294 [Boleophthalmus pectinirostris]|nr:hypothetical protein NL108_009294 [Boleophthalmus pectinirostris]
MGNYRTFRAIRRALKSPTPSKNDCAPCNPACPIHKSTRMSQHDFSKLQIQRRMIRSARKQARSRQRPRSDKLITPHRRGMERRNRLKKRVQCDTSCHNGVTANTPTIQRSQTAPSLRDTIEQNRESP